MIREIRYRGVLIPECRLPGEGKAEGMTPNYAQGIRLSESRWLLLYDTADVRAFDVWGGVFYQIRDKNLDGPIICERMLTPREPASPRRDDEQLWRHGGQPAVFGVPKGRNQANSNVFVITWRNVLIHEKGGVLRHATPQLQETPVWPEGLALEVGGYQEVIQVRLNDREDDIEILSPRQRLRQVGDPNRSYTGWTQPIPDDSEGTSWLNAVHIPGQNRVGVVRYDFNFRSRLYEWTHSGPVEPIGPGVVAREPSLVKLGENDYVVSVRGSMERGETYWLRTPDPLAGLGHAVTMVDDPGQRYAFRCADGQLRIFLNNHRLSPYGDGRNPLHAFEVDPDSFRYGPPVVVADARKLGLRLSTPFVDHVHLFEPEGNRQIITHRIVAAWQVNRRWKHQVSAEEWQDGGIHFSEIVLA